ncbi:MAG: MMPL family transporter [Thermoleophilia bacterium]
MSAATASAASEPVLGPIGRIGRFSASHRRLVAVSWLIVIVALGIFAPRVEHALSGAGWESTGSESVQARELVEQQFQGLSSSALWVVVHSETETIDSPAFQQRIAAAQELLRGDEAVSTVVAPAPGLSISQDGKTAIVQGGSAQGTNGMVEAAERLDEPLSKLAGDGVDVNLTGSSGMWADFNQANREAMMKSELYSWPITLGILVLAFGSLVAAGLPLLLTIVGLIAAAGSLFIATKIGHVSIWAMNFALMFALALGIDYALFIVARFRAALGGAHEDPVHAAATAMDTAGKAVLFSGGTVLISLSAVMLVPSPAFRSMALGIMLSVIFVLAAALTLLPAMLAKLGPKVNKGALRWVHVGEHRSTRFGRWAEQLWKRPALFGLASVAILVALALPALKLDTGMPSIAVVPKDDQSRVGYTQVQAAFGLGAPGALQLVGPTNAEQAIVAAAQADPGIANLMPSRTSADGGTVLIQAVPNVDPSDPAVGETIDRLRTDLPGNVLVGGAVAENHDLESALGNKTPLVIGIVMGLGFVLLLVALQAPLAAALGVITSLLAVGAAFGVGKLVFQDGFAAGLLGFESQGFMNAWAPVFFFAMIFAISMDYTVFLLASAKEHWDRSHDPKEAAVGGVAHSGRTIFAAAAVMVAVFFTFAISGPLPPKEMGIVLGVAVLLDAFLVRLVLMPVLLRATGKWAWYLPRWVDRILPDVTFGH